jgi:putative hemolysin
MIELVAILGLILVNGVFAGAEIAILTLRKTRLQQLIDAGSGPALRIRDLRNHPERFLASVQIGITVVGAAAAALGGATSTPLLESALEAAGVPSRAAHATALATVVGGISYLAIVFGELVPKSLALRHRERYALGVAPLISFLSWLARPAVRALTASSNLVLRPFGDRTTFSEVRLSSEELQELVEEAAKTGSLDEHTSEIASRAIDFGVLTAGQVMVPRNRIDGIPRAATPEDVKRLLLESGHSRMPVYDGALDSIVGYVSLRDVLALAWEGQLVILEDLIRPAVFVPESMRATRVLEEMQRRRTAIAFVVDEHGGISGLVTLRDLIVEVLGRLSIDEHGPAEELIRDEGNGRALVRGWVPIRDLNRALGLDLPEGRSYSTIAGLCLELAGGMPERDARLTAADGSQLEVVDCSPHAVRLVRVIRPTPDSAPG